MKAMKKSFVVHGMDEDKLCKALLQYCNTPSARDKLSPAQKLFGCPKQDTLPAHSRSFSHEWQHSSEEIEHKVITTQQKTMSYYNKAAHPLSDIKQESQVVLQNPRTKLWHTYGVVISVDQHHKYHIKIKSGKVLMRNHRFLCHWVPALNSEATKPQGSVITPASLELSPPTPSSIEKRPRRSS